MNDTQLRDDVLAALAFEPSVDATGIDVTAKEGAITLSGHVPSHAEKLAADACARRVPGVSAVAQELKVRSPARDELSDDEIADRASTILQWSALLPASVVRSDVQNGLVTLSGRVNWQYEREIAENAVKALNGVVGVVNKVEIEPRLQPQDIKRSHP